MSLENHAKNTILVGPWGGHEGHHWDDGAYCTIRQLEIAHGTNGIDSIRIEYDSNGRSKWSEKHGGSGGAKTDKIRLEYPDEYLTSLHGHYGSVHHGGPVFVRSLTLNSNKRKYGPFGVEHGTYFTFPTLHGKIVGFLGKSGWYLDAIGVYVEPVHKPAILAQSTHHPPQQLVAHNQIAGKYDYSMLQGSLGSKYDLIVAVRQKDDYHNTKNGHEPINLHAFKQMDDYHHKSPEPANLQYKANSQDLSHAKPKNEVVSVVPAKKIHGALTCGPWGGSGGSLFDDGIYDGIRQIIVSRNVGITSITVCYDKNGQPVWGSKNGGTGGFRKDKIIFDYPTEILTNITGYHGPTMKMGPNVIKSLTFHTTKGKHGPYGEEEGEYFSTKLKEGSMIVGFHGKKGLFMDSVGVYALEGKVLPTSNTHNKNSAIVPAISTDHKKPESSPPMKTSNQTISTDHKNPQSSPPMKTNNQTALVTTKADNNSQWPFHIGRRGHTNQEAVTKLVKDPVPHGTGPWGGDGGKPWDDGVFSGIKQIILNITDAICSIEIEYDRGGQSVWSVKHGGGGGQTANRVKLDYPHEVLTCVSGYYGPIKKELSNQAIRSLTFHTSRKKYGPFGEELGSYFTSGTTQGKVMGFHGRSSMYLDAIGVHMQHWLGTEKTKQSRMKIFS